MKRTIHERPEEANQRSRAGDLEADTIVCKQSNTAIVSVIDRKNRRAWFRKVDNLKAETVLWALIAILQEIPPSLRHTITFDRGSEFALWHRLERCFGIIAYFCDPYCAWQKGSVEHSNRRFRRFVPKGTDLSQISEEQIAEIEKWVNARPMVCLQDLSAAHAWKLATQEACLQLQ